MSPKLLETIIKGAGVFEDGEMGMDKCIDLFCEELAAQAKALAFKQGALEAGIPLSVIEWKTKLSDHFSAEYIKMQTNPKGEK